MAAVTAATTAAAHGVSLTVRSAVPSRFVTARSTSASRVQCAARRDQRGAVASERSSGKVSASTPETSQSSETG